MILKYTDYNDKNQKYQMNSYKSVQIVINYKHIKQSIIVNLKVLYYSLFYAVWNGSIGSI